MNPTSLASRSFRAAGAFCAIGFLLLAGCATNANSGGTAQAEVAREMPLLGHRNWIVIADSAYPCQTRAGIGTIATNQDQLALVQNILGQVDHARHVRARVFLDAELPHVAEADAPGISAYRAKLDGLLKGRPVESVPHEQIISMLNQAGEEFRILIVKSNMTLPYTSVFVRLECGYWRDGAEQRLRQSMPATQPATQATGG